MQANHAQKNALAVSENFKIRRIYDEKAEIWYFSVVDMISALIHQPGYQAARNYWKALKNRLKKKGGASSAIGRFYAAAESVLKQAGFHDQASGRVISGKTSVSYSRSDSTAIRR